MIVSMMRPLRVLAAGSLFCAAVPAIGCDDNDEVWDTYPPNPALARGLDGAAALIDPPAERVLLLPVDGELQVNPVSVPIGKGFAAAVTTADNARLLVLSRGIVPRRRADDQGPSLAVIDGGIAPGLSATYALSDPLSGITIDPQSEFAVVYASPEDRAFVQNPNELILVDLKRGEGADNPFPLTLRSFGGSPQGFTFTPTIAVPGGARRLLVVRTDRDVALLDLSDLTIPEITVQLTGGAEALSPGGIAVSDGEPDRDDDARVAIRIDDDSNVIIVDLLPVAPGDAAETPQPYRASPNVVFVGGPPTDISFVQTDGGIRLAALIPSRQVLTLVDPATGIASEIELGAAFERFSLVTDVVGGTENGSDVALLWSGSSPNIAFVALGSTVGQPYKSIDRLELTHPVTDVQSVPGPNRHLKLLGAPDGKSFIVLDMLARTASPILASASGTRVTPAPDGARAWMLAKGQSGLAQLDLASLHPLNIALSHPVQDVFDVTRSDGGRALVAVHSVGAGSITVLDAQRPSLDNAREYAALLLGDLR